MNNQFLAVRENFRTQAVACRKMASPFYADLLSELIDCIDESSVIGQVFSNWSGDPHQHAVALRFVAALNHLFITNRAPKLKKIFPSGLGMTTEVVDASMRKKILVSTIDKFQAHILDCLKSPPQTNEVGRCVALLGGFLEVAKRFGPDLDIFEIGASAGLNLFFDQYYYETQNWR